VRRPTFALIAFALAFACAVPAAGDVGAGELRQRAANARARERSLSGDVARLGAAASRLQRQVNVLQSRGAAVQADLDADRTRLARVQEALRAERVRLARLRSRLAQVRRTLAQRLVAAYKTPRSDITTVVLTSQSLSDLLERTRFLKDLEASDRNILRVVRSARGEAAGQAKRLAVDEAQRHDAVVALNARAKALAAMKQAADQRRATLVRIQATRAAALRVTHANRVSLEGRVHTIEARLAAQARAASATTSAAAPSGGWAIPADIVMCESGGQNLPPNSAGASGYYQILPSTWKGMGGSGPAAWKASKAEQDRVAGALWAGGSGAHNWVCASIVG
jgi:septal ring factor EnvC (AmiA/AmiB activator)